MRPAMLPAAFWLRSVMDVVELTKALVDDALLDERHGGGAGARGAVGQRAIRHGSPADGDVLLHGEERGQNRRGVDLVDVPGAVQARAAPSHVARRDT